MSLLKNIDHNLNKKQIIGLILIFTALVAFFVPSAWVSAYWDTEFIESYRGFDIYYFPNINVYGIDVGGDVMDWTYRTNPEACRKSIDLWMDGPIFVETYRDFTIYRIPGYSLYYGESATETSNKWDNLDNLKHYIDVVFYPYHIYTIHSDLGDFLIYQQGYPDCTPVPVYWGELGVYRTLDYATEAKAKEAARTYIEIHTEQLPEPEPEPIPPAQTGLEGRWWVNNIEITNSDQTIILNTTTMKFRFTPTKGSVSSVTISWEGGETDSKKLSKELFSSNWKTTVSLPEGTYTMTLYAEGADGDLTLSLVEFSFNIPVTPDTGNANPDETVDTIGDRVQTMKNLVAGVSGSLGLGLFIFGSIKKEEEE